MRHTEEISAQIHDYARALKKLTQGGNYCPTGREVAQGAHGSEWTVSHTDVDFVMKHGNKIIRILYEQEDMDIILVNRKLYTNFKRKMPATIELAKGVLASKGKAKAYGFWLAQSEDTIWHAAKDRRLDSSLGGIGRVKGSVTLAVNQNRLQARNGQEMVQQIKDKI